MPSILLDTHILVWWRTNPGRLSGAHARTLLELERSGRPAGISAITLWELAMMVERRQLEIPLALDLWLEEIETSPSLSVLPLTARIAAESLRLDVGFPKDPADRIIVATARCHGLRLMTADERILRWGKVGLV